MSNRSCQCPGLCKPLNNYIDITCVRFDHGHLKGIQALECHYSETFTHCMYTYKYKCTYMHVNVNTHVHTHTDTRINVHTRTQQNTEKR